MVDSIISWRILGTRSIPDSSPLLYSGADLELELGDGSRRAFGIRTAALYALNAPARDLGWDDGYRPIPADLDTRTVRFWDFNTILWLGPEPKPCLVWSNATGFNATGIETILTLGNVAALIAGREGKGLPYIDDVRQVTTAAS